MSTTRDRRWGSVLGTVLVFAAGCGLTAEDAATNPSTSDKPSNDARTTTNPASTNHPETNDAPHSGPGSVRCGKCHSGEDRNAPRWKEIAKKIGHDVDAMMTSRTSCTCCHIGPINYFGEPIDRVCLQCHEDVKVTIAKMGSMHCTSCHDPSSVGGALIRESAWECRQCHDKQQGDQAAIDVHASEACTDCHRPHEEPWTIPRNCTDCHVSNDTHHGEKPGASSCDVCHRPHEVGGDAAIRCAECHDQQKPGAYAKASFKNGHDCATCHDAHAGPKAAPRECTSCHSNQHTMPGRGSDKHATCTSCHAPHDARKNAAEACTTCHSTIQPKHPDPKGQSCVACHDPHPKEKTASATLACNQCHEKASSETAFHAGTTKCRDCHAPHAFDAASAVPCKQCHAAETAAGSDGHGHSRCNQCHVTHEPKKKPPACATCHASEHATAPKGHDDCTKCHDDHPKSRLPNKVCVDCHAPQKKGPHERQDCISCHRAHGPDAPTGPKGPSAKPACQSCHPMAQLVSLHAIKDHQTCSDCHSAHQPPKSDRATCMTSCHQNKAKHEPNARSCAGCHAFRPPR